MSSIKEPYSISVWEEELIPAQNWYVKGEKRLNKEEYELLEDKSGYEIHYIMEHYEETQGVIIGAHDMDTPYAAINPVLKENVNGNVELTFSLYYKLYDQDSLDFCINPFTQLLVNEAKVKLNFRNKWYDFVVKSCVEDSSLYTFNYTCKDLYVNELNKNGFSVELDTELENNQNTITELTKTILSETDWEVDEEGSQIIVETKLEPLYFGVLNQDVTITRVSDYTPDEYADMTGQWDFENIQNVVLEKGSKVLFFYSDIVENVKYPQFLARLKETDSGEGKFTTFDPEPQEDNGLGEYQTDANEDIIINAYNYQITSPATYYVDSEIEYNIPSITEEKLVVYDCARGEKVIKNQLSGYDPDLDEFIFKFYKVDENGNPDTSVEYYGYTKTEHLTSKLAQNYLANSDNFTTLQSGWYFDGVPAKTTKTRGVEKTAAYSGQLFTVSDPPQNGEKSQIDQESVLVLQLQNKDGVDYYPDNQGEFYKVTNKEGNTEYIEVASDKGKVFENNVRAHVYDQRDYYVEGYADKTDEELDDIINGALLSNRYSNRARRAVNNGIAANRQVIETLTPGEQYLFAVSLGKFSGDNAPEYGREIKYGGKTPTEYYEFFDSKEHKDYIINAVKEVLGEPVLNNDGSINEEKTREKWNSKYKNHVCYYHHPEYQKTYDSVYKQQCEQAEKDYEDKFLYSLNIANKEAKDLWRSGGDKYRGEIFLEYLRDHAEFSALINGKEEKIKFSEYITNKIKQAAKEAQEGTSLVSTTEQLYNIFIEGYEDTSDSEISNITAHKFYGVYPTLVQCTIDDAEEMQKKWWTINARWEPMAYNNTMFPLFDTKYQDIAMMGTSFNESLFSAFYQGLKQAFLKEQGVVTERQLEIKQYVWNIEGITRDKVETLLKTIYKAAYEEGRFIDVYSKAKQYKMPCLQYPEGGEIYRAYKARWEAAAKKEAEKQALAQNSIDTLFSLPNNLWRIGTNNYNGSSETIEDDCNSLLNFVNTIHSKTNDFNQQYSMEDFGKTKYNKELKKKYIEWIEELAKFNNILSNTYYYANFLPELLEAWVEQQEIDTYVLAEDKYELNNASILEEGNITEENGQIIVPKLDVLNSGDNKIFNPTAKHFVNNLYTTQRENAYAVAVKTSYNPYTNTGDDDAGGYIFDRNEEVIRLFDPAHDMVGATYKPVKNDDGDYIYDPFEQLYRPFRNWSVDERRNPVTFEIDEKVGVYGDVTKHPIKAFDGHIGSWEETPTRYNMIRLRENPEGEDYKYLPREVKVTVAGHTNGKTVTYTMTCPAGYQTDSYIEDDQGQYVKAGDVRKPKRSDLFIQIFGEDVYWKLFGTIDGIEEPQSQMVYQITDNTTKTIWDNIKGFFNSIFVWNDGEDDLSIAYSNSDSGLLISNDEDKRVFYDEDIESAVIYTINDCDISIPTASKISNQSSTKNAELKGQLSQAEGENINVFSDIYIKYKPWYWRHWGKPRYNYKPKICVQKTVNGVTVFKPFNNIEDKISNDYRVMTMAEYNDITEGNKPQISFYLKEPSRQYRAATDIDYGTRKYRMDYQKGKQNKSLWVESPNGEDYLRHYKMGDGEIKLWDGHFGRQIDCFQAVQRPVEENLNEWEPYENTGLITKDNIISLKHYYLQYGDIMIPWDARVFNKDKRFTRQRVKYSEEKALSNDLYVLSDDIYMTIGDYYNNNGFTGKLKYDDLKISFITDFKYDATNFSIKDIPENREEYLSFDLNNTPKGTIDLTVTKTDDNEVKERWIYWIGTVKKQLSLIENPLQTVGMLFETSKDEGKIISYPFLGMQMFKYIPYEKKQTDIKITLIEQSELHNESPIFNINGEISLENGIITIYNKLFGDYEGEQTLLNSNDYEYVKQVLASNKNYATMVSKLFNDYGYVWDISEPEKIEKIETTPIIIPLFPGEAPDARDLFRTLYYIYDPEKVSDINNVVYEYVGTEPIYDEIENPESKFKIAYDEQCQKIRSIKGKESNYFKLIQDCCDTFDCWVEPVIEHNEHGRVEYIEKPVYFENSLIAKNEPQMYIGEDAKRHALDDKIAWYLKRFGYGTNDSRIKEMVDKDNKPIFPTQYETKDDIELEDEEWIELNELNRLSHIIGNLTSQYIIVPNKKIRFRRYVGEENWNGFKYGVNLKHIKRTIDSTQISTRVIVKPNNNEYAKDKMCTIQRAQDNPIKENFLYDFSYYVQQKLLDQRELNNDLYTNLKSRLNYYNELGRLNRDNDKIIEELSSCLVDLDKVTSNYETAVLKRDAAQEEISKLALTFSSNYDTYGQILDVPWTLNKSQEYATKRQTAAPATSFETTATTSNGEILSVVIDMPKTATVIDYPKYNDALRTLLDQMDTYQKEYQQSIADIEKYEPEKETLEKKIFDLEEQQKIIADKKKALNKLFYHKYSRFIQEGSWVDENYIDDNLYYLDALSVLRTSCKPKITYDIGVIDISAAEEYSEEKSVLETRLGDRTYVEDTEFFGYQSDGITPYWERVVISEKTYNLDDPSQNQIKVKNYSTQFDDLFQRIAATSQTLQFNEGSYNRAASILDSNGTIKADLLQQSIEDGNVIAWGATNEDVQVDNTGITIQNPNDANVVKLVSRGIILSTDGGGTWQTAITGQGINASLLTAGRIDTNMLLIGNSENPNFFWNNLGLSAFCIEDDKIDYSSFVRLDQYGIYGIKNYRNKDKTKLSLNDTFVPRSIGEIINDEDAIFGLTWDGFFLNASNGTGRVTIGTQQDFKMSERSVKDGLWKDKVIIGRLQDKSGIEYYGFRLKNDEGQIVMETNDTGELYLKRKLRISNFNDTISKDNIRYINKNYSRDKNYEKIYLSYSTIDGEKQLQLFSDSTKNNLILSIKVDLDDFKEELSLINEELKIEKRVYSSYYIKKMLKTVTNKNIQKKCLECYLYNEEKDLTPNTLLFSLEIDDNETWEKSNFKITNLIYHGYYEKYVVKNDKKYVEYHIKESNGYELNETTKFEEEEIGDNWKDLISTPQDRVTLGIVDVYDRNNSYEKIHIPKGSYNSKDYLTKVFSVKANDTLLIDQLGLRNIKNLIDENEQLAIFDNGTLFAQNAYIEGTINATSGKFENGILGDLSVQGTLTVNSGGIKDQTGQWKIESDGTAHFKNAIISGKLQSTVFEHNEIQTISGGMLIASGIKIKEIKLLEKRENNNKIFEIILDSSTFPESFALKNSRGQDAMDDSQPSTKEKIEQTQPLKVLVFNDYATLFQDGIEASTYEIKEAGSHSYNENGKNEEYVFIKVETSKELDASFQEKYTGTVIFLEAHEEGTGQTFIAINSLNTPSSLPRESISIVDFSDSDKIEIKALLGYFEESFFSKIGEDEFLSHMIGKYGLYCDNVYLKGSMISNTGEYLAGISTTDEIKIDETENAIFFAGEKIKNTENIELDFDFYVTKTGKLYAYEAHLKDGYFSGTIETSKIVGNGKDEYALEILGNSTSKALHFASEDIGNNNTPIIDYFSLTTSGCYFYNTKIYPKENEERNISLLSILYNSSSKGIGMFYNDKTNQNNQDLSNYKLNFQEDQETEEIILSYKAEPLVTIDYEGFHVLNSNDLGKHCKCVEVINSDNDVIGVNFTL